MSGSKIVVKLTSAQRSALETAGLEIDDDPDLSPLVAAWDGGSQLVFSLGERDKVASALTDAANREDYVAEDPNQDPVTRHFARGARTALSNLASKITRAELGGLGAGPMPPGWDTFDADDVFGKDDAPAPSSPEDESHYLFQFLKKPDRVAIGVQTFITVRDLGGREKLLGELNYFDVNDPVLFYAVEEPYGRITVSRSSKRGDYRAVGRPVAVGLARKA